MTDESLLTRIREQSFVPSFLFIRLFGLVWLNSLVCLLLCYLNRGSMVGNHSHFHRFNDLLENPVQIYQNKNRFVRNTFRIIYESVYFKA